MASKANWHSPSATSVIFFCVLPEEVYQFQTKRIGTAALANDLEEMNYFSISFGHFLGFQWVAAAVEKVHSIQSTIWSVLWRIGKTYCPLIFIYKKWLKNCKNKCCLCHDRKSTASYQKFTTQFSVENPSVTFTLHFINTKCKFFSGNFYILHEFAICTKLCAWIWKASCGLYCNLSSNILKANQDFELDIKTFFVCASSKREKAVVVWWCS